MSQIKPRNNKFLFTFLGLGILYGIGKIQLKNWVNRLDYHIGAKIGRVTTESLQLDLDFSLNDILPPALTQLNLSISKPSVQIFTPDGKVVAVKSNYNDPNRVWIQNPLRFQDYILIDYRSPAFMDMLVSAGLNIANIITSLINGSYEGGSINMGVDLIARLDFKESFIPTIHIPFRI